MPNTQKIKDFLEQYKNNFTQYWLNEKYKWQAIKCFQDNWNIDATNFYTMFKNALDKTQNLLTSHNFFAKEMILEFIKIEPENVREMFRNLFDEEESLNQRINNFINSSNILKEKNSKWKNHYQNMTAISTYLWLKYPDKYYICKYLECKNIINIFDFNIDLKDGDTANNILSCIDVYDEICAILSKNNELIELFRSCLTQDCYFDPLFKTLTIDFCFQCYIKFNHQEKNYWLYAPGENAKYWDKFYKEGIMAIGWDYLGDLNNYNDKKSLSEKMQNIHNWTSYPRNNVSTLWSFRNDIKPGDIIFVKNGVSNIVGRGVVLSDYIYDSKREDEYKNIRKVYWTHKGRWQYSKNLPQKTLTNISQPSINELENLLTDSNDEIKKVDSNIRYWWLNANPKIWQFNNFMIGEEQIYTLYNDNHNKRRIFQNFLDAKPGDIIIGYETTPSKQIVALGVVSKEHDDKNFYFKKTEQLAVPIDYQDLLHIPELQNMEYLKNVQGSLFSLTSEEYNVLMDIIRDSNPIRTEKEVIKPYDDKNFLSEVFMSGEDFEFLKNLLIKKKNLILQGPPGVGKTFAAKRLAYAILERKDDSHIEKVQFHQNYSYEDFIMGYKPQENGFKLENGIFYQFCMKAINNPDNKPYFFIIDEINRGNMSKIFGELLMLIEKNYRGPNNSITMAYSKTSFYIPENIYIIGTMNTADRSLAMIDYALRRRFCFYTMRPAFDTKSFKDYQQSLKNSLFDNVIQEIKNLNTKIIEDDSLGENFCIGHSYFCNQNNYTPDELYSIIFYEIIPTLEEYYFNESQKLEEWKKIFNGIFNDKR